MSELLIYYWLLPSLLMSLAVINLFRYDELKEVSEYTSKEIIPFYIFSVIWPLGVALIFTSVIWPWLIKTR